jgi:hypothetical protein
MSWKKWAMVGLSILGALAVGIAKLTPSNTIAHKVGVEATPVIGATIAVIEQMPDEADAGR